MCVAVQMVVCTAVHPGAAVGVVQTCVEVVVVCTAVVVDAAVVHAALSRCRRVWRCRWWCALHSRCVALMAEYVHRRCVDVDGGAY